MITTTCLISLFLLCSSCIFDIPRPEPVTDPVDMQVEKTVEADPETPESAPLIEEAPEAINDIYHYVQWNGETLSIIARWYTGELKNWKALAIENPEINPHILHMNTKIRIPSELIINRNPMPKEFIDQFTKKKKKPVPVDAEPLENDDDMQLFGPKTYQPE